MAGSTASTRTSVDPLVRPGSRDSKKEPSVEDDVPPTVRRSGRARRPPAILSEETNGQDAIKTSPTFPKSVEKAGADEQRRNPKRKAAPEVFDLPDDLLDKALAPMGADELDEWEGWVELESDPAFFNVVLQDLGVKDAKIQELFSLDEGSLAVLPKPVHGLIFLYQYVEEDAQEPTENGKKVWFANQTTNNACATVALLNIIMNAEDIELGDRLKAFKEQSSTLIPPLRGDLLCNTAWIRNIHNQFSRRIDLLNADLVLEQAAKEAKKKKAKPKGRTAKRRKTKPSSDAAFHFIAYVPVGDEVYQLDGLEKEPTCIGKIGTDTDWTDIARPMIEARMLQYESEALSFNLLALCGSPLQQLREELTKNIVEQAQVQQALHKINPDMGKSYPGGIIPSTEDMCFADFGLPDTLSFDTATQHPIETQPLEDADLTLVQKLEARLEELETEQTRLKAEYRTEVSMAEDDASRANGRKKDYTPVIHRWVERLAQTGALQEIAEQVALQQP